MTEAERLRAARLKAYVQAATDQPATFDECSTWPAQWVVNERGVAFDWPVYADEAEMQAMLAREGGLVAVWDRVASLAGLVPVPPGETPPLGSIGVFKTDNHGGCIGGIFADGQVINFRVFNVERPHRTGVRAIGLYPHTILKAWFV